MNNYWYSSFKLSYFDMTYFGFFKEKDFNYKYGKAYRLSVYRLNSVQVIDTFSPPNTIRLFKSGLSIALVIIMNNFKIVEPDQDYKTTITAMLKDQYGISPNEKGVFTSENSQEIVDTYHGLKIVEDVQSEDSNEEAYTWIKNYSGTFSFYLSLKEQYLRKGFLSEAQINSVFKAMTNETAYLLRKNSPQEGKVFSLKNNSIILLSKFIGIQIASNAGLTKPFYLFEVVKVEAETEKAYKATLKMTAQRTSHCGQCGIRLTNEKSVAAGIGPICAERLGIPYGEDSLTELKKLLLTKKEVSTWIPKKCIKEIIKPMENV